MPNRILSVRAYTGCDDNPCTDYLDQPEFAARLAAYRNGDFNFIFVRATADVQFGDGQAVQTLSSMGLYGIEDDSTAAYIAKVKAEELDGLADVLRAAGFAEAAIAEARERAA